MKKGRGWSLRLRLSLFFAALSVAAWLVAAFFSWWASKEHIDAFFDTQQMLFAKRLASARYESLMEKLPDTDDILSAAGRGDEGEQEDDSLAFAVFDPQGRLLLSDGEDGRDFKYDRKANGFVNTSLEGDLWRIVWLRSLDRKIVVAVGQEIEYRDEMALKILAGQMLPWLALLPVLLAGLVWMLSRELAPLRSVAADLAKRDPNDVSPIEISVQPEIGPLLRSLNSLFARIEAMLGREREFIANAAHELRTPLAGLSIQAQVAQKAIRPQTRDHALGQLLEGIHRSSRLVDQLLTLFRLEAPGPVRNKADDRGPNPFPDAPSWSSLIEKAVEEVRETIEAKNIQISLTDVSGKAAINGRRELAAAGHCPDWGLEILLRNLVGNAAKYTPEAGRIDIILENGVLSLSNSSPDIAPSDAARLGERFFRPPGQSEAGSGLGLSIARRISELQGIKLIISPAPGRFSVKLYFPNSAIYD